MLKYCRSVFLAGCVVSVSALSGRGQTTYEPYTITTLAGVAGATGAVSGSGNDARFNSPYGLALDTTGNIYVADTFNQIIRKVTPAGVVSTVAGVAGVAGSVDGPASSAQFKLPYAVAVDGAGNLFVADTYNHTIRKVSVGAGTVSTVAGLTAAPGSSDGQGSAARFRFQTRSRVMPQAIFLSPILRTTRFAKSRPTEWFRHLRAPSGRQARRMARGTWRSFATRLA